MDNTLSSKAILFLAFQMAQNKHNGPACHIVFLFLPTKEPLHHKRVSFYRKEKHPRHSKQRKEQHPHFPCFFTMKKEVISQSSNI